MIMLMRNMILGAGIFLGASFALAQTGFEGMDEDGDGSISKDEYYGYIGDAGLYADWDQDSDGFIDESEYDAFDF